MARPDPLATYTSVASYGRYSGLQALRPNPLPPKQKDNTMNKRALATIGVATMIALAVPGIASAHNATATPGCTGLSWSATNYDKTVTNSIVVKVDGVTVHADADFKASDSGASPWSQTANHAWSVVVNAPGTAYDKSFSGTWQACVATTTTPSSTTVVVATTAATSTTTVTAPSAPATTVVTDPTTTIGATCCPPVPPTTAAMDVVALTPDEPVLPRTGLDGGDISGIAICLMLCGGFLLYVRRIAR